MIGTIVTTKYGKVQGIAEDGCIIFKGIPYAKPPVGELRFRAPQPADAWEGMLVADHFANRCMQAESADGGTSFYGREFYQDRIYATSISEDGLYLNIWVPQDRPDEELLPVAFYIHGGGFGSGCGHEVEFRTNAYAKKDVILITINYRLGLLGFLATKELAQEDPVACGNYGILDQIAALTWVQENIRAFGGDPDNVTIFGQSAGCMSVQTLLSTPYADGKYAKAILQSGAGYPVIIDQDEPLDEACGYGQMILEMAGVTSTAQLRALPGKTLLEIQEQMNRRMMESGRGLIFRPVQNGALRAKTYDDLVRDGLLADIPMMIGSTKNDITVGPQETAGGRRSRFQENCLNWSLQMEICGHRPSYVYYFTRDLPGDDAGAFHSSELWYMFGTLDSCWRPMTAADFSLSERMVSYWTNFMKTGDPNGSGLPDWQPHTRAQPFEMIFDINV